MCSLCVDMWMGGLCMWIREFDSRVRRRDENDYQMRLQLRERERGGDSVAVEYKRRATIKKPLRVYFAL